MVDRSQRILLYHPTKQQSQNIKRRDVKTHESAQMPAESQDDRRNQHRNGSNPVNGYATLPRSGARRLFDERPRLLIETNQQQKQPQQRMRAGLDNGRTWTRSGAAKHTTISLPTTNGTANKQPEYQQIRGKKGGFYGKSTQPHADQLQQHPNVKKPANKPTWPRKKSSATLKLQSNGHPDTDGHKPRPALLGKWTQPRPNKSASLATHELLETPKRPTKKSGSSDSREAQRQTAQPKLLLVNLSESARKRNTISNDDVTRALERFAPVKFVHCCPIDGCQFLVQFSEDRRGKAEEATKMEVLPKESKSDETETEEDATCRHSDIESAYRLLMNGSFSPVGTPMKDCRKAPPNNDDGLIDYILGATKNGIILKGFLCSLTKPKKVQSRKDHKSRSFVEGPSPDRPTNRLPPTNVSTLSDIYWRYTQNLAEMYRLESLSLSQSAIGTLPSRPRSLSSSTDSTSFIPPLLSVDTSSDSSYLPLAPPYHILPDTAYFRSATIIPPPNQSNEGLPTLKRIHNRYITSMMYADEQETALFESCHNDEMIAMQKMAGLAEQFGSGCVPNEQCVVYPSHQPPSCMYPMDSFYSQSACCFDQTQTPNIVYSENIFDFNALTKARKKVKQSAMTSLLPQSDSVAPCSWTQFVPPNVIYYTDGNNRLYAFETLFLSEQCNQVNRVNGYIDPLMQQQQHIEEYALPTQS
ncbi:hypothetical protein WR25_13205 [Diploscapter pachys]|uniref:Uncharacterized protein n=1 Tax=Diploscapter pachys TaxID=2018661 RepID=A0A2A2KYH8_9BILA|nr:hypothetical protein WR25_13205 [Diploscapter pachys]